MVIVRNVYLKKLLAIGHVTRNVWRCQPMKIRKPVVFRSKYAQAPVIRQTLHRLRFGDEGWACGLWMIYFIKLDQSGRRREPRRSSCHMSKRTNMARGAK